MSKKNFFKRLRFKYNMIILNENTLEEVFHIHVSRLSLISALSLFTLITFVLLSLLILLTPLKNMLPGYGDVSIRTDVIQGAIKVDSLENMIYSHNRQLNALKNIISGNISIDSINSTPDSILSTYKGLDLSASQSEENYINQYEEENKYNITTNVSNNSTLLFIAPLKGTVIQQFAPEKQIFGIDIISAKNQPVMACSDGTIIMMTSNINGYDIMIQHDNGVISIYKHIQQSLVKTGKQITGGEVIGFTHTPATNDLSTEIRFELWQNGVALNPEEYIIM